jgi:hypothetical protein
LKLFYINKNRDKNEQVDEDYCPSELDEKLDDIEFTNDLSSGSCAIDQIEGILVGGYNTRFWMNRKHLINYP